MSGRFDVSPEQLRHHARTVGEVARGIRSQHAKLDACHVGEGGFGVFFGWMAEGFNSTNQTLVETLDAQAQLLGRYADGLTDTAQDFEELEALVAVYFAAGDVR